LRRWQRGKSSSRAGVWLLWVAAAAAAQVVVCHLLELATVGATVQQHCWVEIAAAATAAVVELQSGNVLMPVQMVL
jgi:hypothetical protein